jgi:hypothetical protein
MGSTRLCPAVGKLIAELDFRNPDAAVRRGEAKYLSEMMRTRTTICSEFNKDRR